jgi:hypothetical protein
MITDLSNSNSIEKIVIKLTVSRKDKKVNLLVYESKLNIFKHTKFCTLSFTNVQREQPGLVV